MTERQQEIYEAACSFLVEQRITSLPVNPFDIIARSHWGLATYRRLGLLSDAAGSAKAATGSPFTTAETTASHTTMRRGISAAFSLR